MGELKKEALIFFWLFLIVGLLSVSLISASFFSDFFAKLTGKAIANTTTSICTDSDGINIYEKGIAKYKCSNCSSYVNYTDYCKDSSLVYEFFCNGSGNNVSNGLYYLSGLYNCPSGMTCSNGACKLTSTNTTIPSCSDTDGGKSYFLQGNTNSTSGSFGVDFCFTTNILWEYFCNNNTGSSMNYTCPNGCSSGACKTPINTTTLVCSDTDGGKNYYQKGIMTGEYTDDKGRRYDSWTDYCGSGNTEGYLTEFSCSNQNYGWTDFYKCPNGCSNGACNTPLNTTTLVCSDTDGGINALVKGYISGKDTNGVNYANNTDYCSGGTFLIEYFCNSTNSYVYTKSINCSFGCLNGVCKTTSSNTTTSICTDTDGGTNYYSQGTLRSTKYASTANTSFIDYCSTNTTLNEYFCSNDLAVSSTSYTCPSGCSSGACKNVSTNITIPSCIDGDGGINYYLKGTLNATSGSKGSDYCFTTNILGEYFCNNNTGSSMNYTCPYGCLNGACKSVPSNLTNQTTLNNTTNLANVTTPTNKTSVNSAGTTFNQTKTSNFFEWFRRLFRN